MGRRRGGTWIPRRRSGRAGSSRIATTRTARWIWTTKQSRGRTERRRPAPPPTSRARADRQLLRVQQLGARLPPSNPVSTPSASSYATPTRTSHSARSPSPTSTTTSTSSRWQPIPALALLPNGPTSRSSRFI
ncbi:hypothetical protein BCR35DRAFT_298236 [Leucosporidium creatinivorum]|uniref:Uncharacterized protein n=1 Tax=Leucosporidium creatinivorum TaxID=106004 RepID=A0A1Y2G483_9BASI|nr:hypothetical protein BCR35DRAFT_298236 [Leucosporidium creatinivorum]